MKLELRGAGKRLSGRWALRGVSLELNGGCLLALLGPNGSGKSTALRLLGGLWPPDEGAVWLDGRNLAQLSRRTIARRIAYTPQDTHLDFAFTVHEIVLTGRHPHLGRFQPEGERDRAAVDQAMRRADVAHLADRLVNELSGGERQRVLIARSLATEAPILLLDEPASGLDIAHALDLLALCRALAREGKAVVAALHDLNHAARFADEIVLLHGGAVAARGAAATTLSPETIGEVFGVRASRAATDAGEHVFLFER